MELRKLEDKEPAEVAYYEGYQRGHLDTARMLARRSLVYLLLGGFMGAGLFFLALNYGLMDRAAAEKVVEDPALTQEKPRQYVNAINWARRFTVGIVAKTSARVSPSRASRIPGQSHVGSGIVLNEQGYILTNSHVIPGNTNELSVVLGDSLYEARFVGHRPEYDLAVIKIVADNLVAASLGDSDKAEQGDVVVAIGSPHGLFHTATEGIVSYVGRRNADGSTLVRNFIQTSAAINPGNSGGPLIDLTGRVIGINTLKLAGEGGEGADGIGFAIPINLARRVADTIIKGDDPARDSKISSRPRSLQSAFLGVNIETGFRPEMQPGALIRNVIYGTAADRAGLRAGDLITRVGDTPVTSFEDLSRQLRQLQPGDKVLLTYRRDGREHTIEVFLGE
ncbi:MAG: trypsin-like peptidase domain-containing protein [Planctomycetes bacterium]|jgi:S1-C subfamily serine protease|nr:trypsin-like peptidase domain-containing protein [Planctomycetota bacterium]MCL4730556.1 trypsin-like peptidase domain-containing protein [Planctomycetota bacterium]